MALLDYGYVKEKAEDRWGQTSKVDQLIEPANPRRFRVSKEEQAIAEAETDESERKLRAQHPQAAYDHDVRRYVIDLALSRFYPFVFQSGEADNG